MGVENRRLREGQMVLKGAWMGEIWGRREPRKALAEASARQREYLEKALGWEGLDVGERQKEAEPWNGKVVSESWAPKLRLWRPPRYNEFDIYSSDRKSFTSRFCACVSVSLRAKGRTNCWYSFHIDAKL